MSDDLSAEAIEARVRGRLGRPVRFFGVIGSTNDEALRWAHLGAPEGALVVADHQTAGRGRRERAWLDRPGSSLMFSLVLRPPGDLEALNLLTTAAGLACADGVESASGLRTGLKWPNDVTLGGKKLAGLLVESVTRGGRLEVAVVGCGLNLRLPEGMPADVAREATSIADSPSGGGEVRPANRIELLTAILWAFEHLYGGLTDPDARAELLRRAEARSELLGRTVTARTAGGETLTGTARGLTPSGGLEIEADGAMVSLSSGEITRLRLSGPLSP